MARGKGGQVRIELIVDDKGTVKLVEAKRHVDDLGSRGRRAGEEAAGGLNQASTAAMRLTKQLAAAVGVTLSVAGAIYAVRHALSSWFRLIRRGVMAVEDYKTSIIGAAAVMTDMTDRKFEPDLSKAYRAWKDYFEWLWRASIEADKKVAASGREVFEVAMELAKRGAPAATREQVEIAGRLMDRIRATAPITGNIIAQVRAEVRDLFTGTVRMGSQLAQFFQQYDENFKEHIRAAVQEGRDAIYKYLADALKGVEVAAEDIANTWGSVKATLDKAFDEVMIHAFSDAYERLVAMAKELTEWLLEGGELTAEGKRLAEALRRAWDEAADAIYGALRYFLENPEEIIAAVGDIAAGVGKIASAAATAAGAMAKLVGWIEKGAGYVRQFQGLMEKLGPGRVVPPGGGVPYAPMGEFGALFGVMPPKQMGPAERALFGVYQRPSGRFGDLIKSLFGKEAPTTPPIRTGGGGGEGGGGGGGRGGGRGADSRQIEALIRTLENDVARAAGTAQDQIDRWYDQTIAKIREYAATAEQAEKAVALAKMARASKMQNLEQDFLAWYAKETGDTLKQIDIEEERVAKRFGEREEAKQIFAAKRLADQVGKEGELLQVTAEQLQAELDMTSNFGDQTDLLARISDLTYEIAMKELDRLDALGKITPELLKQKRVLEALRKEARDYRRDVERAGGIRGGVLRRRERRESPGQRQARATERMFGDLDSALSKTVSSLGKMLVGLEEADFETVAKEFAAMFIDYMTELLMSEVSPVIEEMLMSGFQAVGQFLLGLFGGIGENLMELFSDIGGGLFDMFTEAGQFLLSIGRQMAQILIAAGQIIAALIRAALGLFGLFHAGGIVSHSGGVMAHAGAMVAMAHAGMAGLGPDERLVRAKVGEMFISPAATSQLQARNPNSFAYLQRGEVPPEAGKAGGGKTTIINNITFKPPSTATDFNRFTRRITPALLRRERRRVA